MITAILVAAAVVGIAVWLLRTPPPLGPPPIVYTTTGGAKVTAYPPAGSRGRWRWECDGCRTTAVATAPGEDLRPDANQHAEHCRALPPAIEAKQEDTK